MMNNKLNKLTEIRVEEVHDHEDGLHFLQSVFLSSRRQD